MKTLELLLISMRPGRLWRTAVIFLPLLFSGNPLDIIYILKLCVGFVIFSLLTGSISIIDDISKYESNKKDPVKRLMPIASGEISVERAEFALGVMMTGALVSAFFLGSVFGVAAVVYFFTYIAYYLFLKNLVIIDAITVAVESCICLFAGTVAIGKPVSPWLMVLVLTVAVFLVFCERRRALIIAHEPLPAAAAETYSERLLDQLINASAPFALITFAMYAMGTLEGTQNNLIYSVPFVMYGVYRIYYLTYTLSSEKPLEKLIAKDPYFWVDLILWAVLVAGLMIAF